MPVRIARMVIKRLLLTKLFWNANFLSKSSPGIKNSTIDDLVNLGLTVAVKSQADLLEKKSDELKKCDIENLDVHYGFYMLEICFTLPTIMYFL